MSDITKCDGLSATDKECPLRDKCWRYLAPANEKWQSWMAAPFYIELDGISCDDYWRYDPEKTDFKSKN